MVFITKKPARSPAFMHEQLANLRQSVSVRKGDIQKERCAMFVLSRGRVKRIARRLEDAGEMNPVNFAQALGCSVRDLNAFISSSIGLAAELEIYAQFSAQARGEVLPFSATEGNAARVRIERMLCHLRSYPPCIDQQAIAA